MNLNMEFDIVFIIKVTIMMEISIDLQLILNWSSKESTFEVSVP